MSWSIDNQCFEIFKTYLETICADYFISPNWRILLKFSIINDEPFERAINPSQNNKIFSSDTKNVIHNIKYYITRSVMCVLIIYLSYIIIIIMDVYNRAQLSPMYYYLWAPLYFTLY